MRTTARYSLGTWLAHVLVVMTVVWLALFLIHVSLPNVRPGADLVYNAKTRIIASEHLFPDNAPRRVVLIGNSKTLAGFDPVLFDSLSGFATSSYNCGLPNNTRVTDHVEAMCGTGQAPTHVLLQIGWSDRPPESASFFQPRIDDTAWMERLFPFRKLPRNLFIFLLRAREKGGVVSFYRYADEQVATMKRQRGYYFIEGQSHFPGNRLPEGFTLATDKPNTVAARDVRTDVPEFQHLRDLAERYGFVVYLVPSQYRESEYAPPPPVNRHTAEVLAPYPRFAVVGPDYVRLPNKYFADPVHLNPEGAAEYTRLLHQIVAPKILNDPTPAACPVVPVADQQSAQSTLPRPTTAD
jgi:hypothetical protein